jgi:transcriptional regulator with XRE-family HTH domain
METLRELTAAELRAALARRRISAVELARRIGWSQAYMARRTDGRIALDIDDLEKIATELNVPVTALLPAEAHTSRYLPGEHVLTTVGEPTPARDGVRRPVKLRRPTGATSSARPITPTAA